MQLSAAISRLHECFMRQTKSCAFIGKIRQASRKAREGQLVAVAVGEMLRKVWTVKAPESVDKGIRITFVLATGAQSIVQLYRCILDIVVGCYRKFGVRSLRTVLEEEEHGGRDQPESPPHHARVESRSHFMHARCRSPRYPEH